MLYDEQTTILPTSATTTNLCEILVPVVARREMGPATLCSSGQSAADRRAPGPRQSVNGCPVTEGMWVSHFFPLCLLHPAPHHLQHCEQGNSVSKPLIWSTKIPISLTCRHARRVPRSQTHKYPCPTTALSIQLYDLFILLSITSLCPLLSSINFFNAVDILQVPILFSYGLFY